MAPVEKHLHLVRELGAYAYETTFTLGWNEALMEVIERIQAMPALEKDTKASFVTYFGQLMRK